MQSDTAYLAQYPPMLNLLREASGGNIASIPNQYLNNFHHTYANGDISLIPKVSSLSNTDFLETWQIDELAESLSRVNPRGWPDLEDIVNIDAQRILNEESETDHTVNFVEDNLGTADKTEKIIKIVIESVFGKGVSAIRDRGGNFPSPKNNFLQEEDGTFAGTFKHDEHIFSFEIAPREVGWICTYRLTEKSLDKLEKPKFKSQRDDNQHSNRNAVRTKAWR